MDHYNTFRRLHHRERPFILANVWNVQSALVMEQNGFEAIGTSSGAIAHSLGYQDGEDISFDELLYVVQRISSNVQVPLTVDMERGYAMDEKRLTDNIQRLIDAHVVGINIEDTQGEAIYLKKLYTIRDYLEKSNQKLFVNARTDGFLKKLDKPLKLTIRRAEMYRDAGADGLFVTGLSDLALIKEIAASIPLPLNVIGNSKLLSIGDLTDCGVKRVSMAGTLYKVVYGYLGKLAKEIMDRRTFESLY